LDYTSLLLLQNQCVAEILRQPATKRNLHEYEVEMSSN
jgi:hypothetical protein